MISGGGILNDLLSRIAEVGRSLALGSQAQGGDPLALCENLLSGKGEATGLAIAQQIFDAYAKLDAPSRVAFFREIKDRFDVDGKALAEAMTAWRKQGPTAGRALHFASEPRSQELMRRLNRAPGGTRALVAMRADLLDASQEDPELQPLDTDFQHLLASWFNRGFLELRRIDWSTSAEILEKIIAYEAVHEIAGWDDLRRRVAAPDRRLYGFFHPALNDDPLIFVEVALTAEIPGAITPILAEDRVTLEPAKATTAVFYSISNCQKGLRNISFGNFLIKQVVEELRREFENLTTYVTLSPVPGLRRWVEQETQESDGLLSGEQHSLVEKLASYEEATDSEDLLGLAAVYLLEARAPRGGARDPVARFHLGNGASLHRINLAADLSTRGRANAWGVMVNYLYDLKDIEKNHEAYANDGSIAAASAVQRLLRSSKRG
ncbi:malonyl-CoA decarboxylase [Pelagibius litoralis]|uniref:Malonyl-CoA decarboxylase n=1 Tax=Pelagibius litoralis TaxID=374515 RepID=A0A967C5G3_9PROT|nr:malonyl-CoA decarboxylase [Pelagibius litoralis]NIA69099.1 malonyl-CoA decarboxylase [Pelagibius litoralis]